MQTCSFQLTRWSGDPAHAERLERMKSELDTWMRSVVRSLNGDDYNARPR